MPYFSNKQSKDNSDILLIAKDKLLVKNKKVADIPVPIFSQSPNLLIYLNDL